MIKNNQAVNTSTWVANLSLIDHANVKFGGVWAGVSLSGSTITTDGGWVSSESNESWDDINLK